MGNRLTANSRVTKVRLEPAAEGSAQNPVQVQVDTRADSLAVEEPLQIRVDGEDFTTTMRTPGNDFELVHGLLHAEDVIHNRDDVVTMRYCAGAVGPGGQNTYNTIDVELRRSRPSDPLGIPLPLLNQPVFEQPVFDQTTQGNSAHLPTRNVITTSACGICGTTSIEDLVKRRRYPIRPVRPEAEFVVNLPEKIRSSQKAFRRTGGIHAAGAVSGDGDVLLVREDVGRHNAADKVIGALLMNDQLPAEGLYLVMTSRASFELVQKAVLAGFSGLVAVSAATSLAVDLAKETGLFLTGFTRDNRFNLYSGALADSSL